MFENNDLAMLKTLTALITQKVKFTELNHIDISKAYHCFEWLQGLEEKIRKSHELRLENEDLQETIKVLEKRIEDVREEQPKKRTTRKSRKKKDVS